MIGMNLLCAYCSSLLAHVHMSACPSACVLSKVDGGITNLLLFC